MSSRLGQCQSDAFGHASRESEVRQFSVGVIADLGARPRGGFTAHSARRQRLASRTSTTMRPNCDRTYPGYWVGASSASGTTTISGLSFSVVAW